MKKTKDKLKIRNEDRVSPLALAVAQLGIVRFLLVGSFFIMTIAASFAANSAKTEKTGTVTHVVFGDSGEDEGNEE